MCRYFDAITNRCQLDSIFDLTIQELVDSVSTDYGGPSSGRMPVNCTEVVYNETLQTVTTVLNA